jgi:hypothetical protein
VKDDPEFDEAFRQVMEAEARREAAIDRSKSAVLKRCSFAVLCGTLGLVLMLFVALWFDDLRLAVRAALVSAILIFVLVDPIDMSFRFSRKRNRHAA